MICLGKFGDLYSALRLVRHEYETSGRKPTLVVSRAYCSPSVGLDYADPLLFPGHWTDLAGAIRFTKQFGFRKVISLATHGKDFPIEHRTSSFQLEPFERAGALHLWDKLPLVVCDPGGTHQYDRPTILLADHSQSSPFLDKNALHALLTKEFPDHDILRLDGVRSPRLEGFLPFYRGAAALVTIECVHLHLSAATPHLPVAALATDRPSRWHGSSWSNRFAWYGRYGQFRERSQEMVESLRDAMLGREKPEITVLE